MKPETAFRLLIFAICMLVGFIVSYTAAYFS